MSKDIETIIAAAEAHGAEGEPDHEVGDLQAALRLCWSSMTFAARSRVLSDDTITDLLADYGEDPEERDPE